MPAELAALKSKQLCVSWTAPQAKTMPEEWNQQMLLLDFVPRLTGTLEWSLAEVVVALRWRVEDWTLEPG